MALLNLSTLLPQITPFLHGCPSPVQAQGLRRMARKFCIESGIWIETLDSFNTVADQAAYTLTIPTDVTQYDAVFERIMQVKVGGSIQNESVYKFSPDHILTFDPAPTSIKAVLVDAVFRPKETCDKYPDWLVNRWQDGFVFGTLWFMKSAEKVAWSDPAGAAKYGVLYNDVVFNAKCETIEARLTRSTFVKQREFV